MTPRVDRADSLFDALDAAVGDALASLDRAERSLAEICAHEPVAAPVDDSAVSEAVPEAPAEVRLDLWALRLPDSGDPVATPPFGVPDLTTMPPPLPAPEPEVVVASAPRPQPVVAWEPEPEPVVAWEPEPEPEPIVAWEPEPEPEPVVEREPEPLREPVVAWEPEPEPEPEPILAPEMASPPRTALIDQAVQWTAGHPILTRRIVAGTLAGIAVVAGLVALIRPGSAPDGGTADTAPAAAVDPDLVRVATAGLPLVDVYESPTRSTVVMTLEHPTALGAPLVFVVEGEWEGWYKVRLPAEPAGTTGWIRAGDVTITEHRTRVTLDLGDRLLVARVEGEIVLRAPVALGRFDQPAPGSTFVNARVDLGERQGTYGARALPLAGYGNGPETVFRGTGFVGMHAVGDPLMLGQTVLKGSVGLAAADLDTLYDVVAPGTPVDITD